MEKKRYQERLTPDKAALLLIDHQVGLFTGVRDIPVAELKHNVVALAKAVKVLGVPIIVTARRLNWPNSFSARPVCYCGTALLCRCADDCTGKSPFHSERTTYGLAGKFSEHSLSVSCW